MSTQGDKPVSANNTGIHWLYDYIESDDGRRYGRLSKDDPPMLAGGVPMLVHSL
jgi:hypothetical protein